MDNVNTYEKTSKKDIKKESFNNKTDNSLNNHQSFKKKNEDELNYLKYRNDELNKELLEKMDQIHQLSEKVTSSELKISNYKKSFQQLNERISKADNLKVDINILNKKISDLESELNFNKIENSRLGEIIRNKDNLISEFQNLVGVSTNKFQIFEDTNKSLKNDNAVLKNKLDELLLKLDTFSQREKMALLNIEELKSTINKKDNEIEKLKLELARKQELHKKRMDEEEENFGNQLKMKEEEMKNNFNKEFSKMKSEIDKNLKEIEKIKYENKQLSQNSVDLKNEIQEKEKQFKRALDNKEQEYSTLTRSLQELQKAIKEIEISSKQKIESFQEKNKLLIDEDIQIKKEIQHRDKKIKELQREIAEMNKILDELGASVNNNEITIENKDSIITTLKSEINEMKKEFSNIKMEYQEKERKFNHEFEIQLNKIKILEREKEILLKGKENDNSEINELKEKLSDFHENHKKIIANHKIEKEQHVQNNSKELTTAFNLKEDQYINEISRLQNIILEKDKEKNYIKMKNHKKFHAMKLKIEEQETRIQNLIKNLTTIKDWALTMETNIKNSDHFNSQNSISKDNKDSMNILIQTDNQKNKYIESLRENINNIDYAINSDLLNPYNDYS